MIARMMPLALAIVHGGVALAADGKQRFPEPTGVGAKALALIDVALAEDDLENVHNTRGKIIALLGQHSPVSQLLSESHTLSQRNGETVSVEQLREALQAAREMVAFQPVCEADIPAGFPTYTPVGVIEIKNYPRRRLAVGGGFWPLFRHITTNDVAMTTPVRMVMSDDDSGRLKQASMAFYYGNADLGETGERGSVQVVDEGALTVVAIGARGRSASSSIQANAKRLRSWIAESPVYEAAGSVRSMGYNSPMLSASRQFHEVQIPVRRVDSTLSE